jgi:uncharacterized membrane protein
LTLKPGNKGEVGLEIVISYLLIAGVVASVILEIIGVALFYHTYKTLSIQYGGNIIIQGHDFFSFINAVVRGRLAGGAAIQLMTAGILVLLLTPFLRVLFSMFYFFWENNYKYVVITLFVLLVLTISLTIH